MVLQVLMPFRRGSRMGTQIHSLKHVIDVEGALSGGVASVVPLTQSVQSRATPFEPVEMINGETINAFFLSIFMIGATGSGQNGSINWYIAKARSGQSTVTDFPDPAVTGGSNVRNQIFHEEKGLAGSADGTPMAFKGVVVVPRSMRRFRDGDQFIIKLRSTDITNDVNFCVKAIYKSFS